MWSPGSSRNARGSPLTSHPTWRRSISAMPTKPRSFRATAFSSIDREHQATLSECRHRVWAERHNCVIESDIGIPLSAEIHHAVTGHWVPPSARGDQADRAQQPPARLSRAAEHERFPLITVDPNQPVRDRAPNAGASPKIHQDQPSTRRIRRVPRARRTTRASRRQSPRCRNRPSEYYPSA